MGFVDPNEIAQMMEAIRGSAPGLVPTQQQTAGAGVDQALASPVSQPTSAPLGPGSITGGDQEGEGIWGKIKGVLGSDKMMLPAMALMQWGAALQAPKDQRGAILARIPGNMAAMMAVQQSQKKTALAEKLAQKKIDASNFDKEWWINDDTGEKRQFPPGGPVPSNYSRVKETTSKETEPKLQERYNPDTGLKEKVQWNSETKSWDVVGGQASEKEKLNSITIINKSLEEKLGRIPTSTELNAEILNNKKAIAISGATGKIEGTAEGTSKTVSTLGDGILKGKMTLEYIKNAFGDSQSNRVAEYVLKKDPDYNFITASANSKWYQNPGTQRLIRRTESIVAPDGPVDEAIRFAKLVNNPAGTPLNKLTGKAGVALGNSKRQLLELVHGINAEEIQQIMGSQGGGERFLEFTRQLSDPNLSVEQYVNAAKELRYLIMTRQIANVRGTPEQEKWEGFAEKLKIDLPYRKIDTNIQRDTGKKPVNEKVQYMLPKNGQMVPVDKATYDAYQRKWGR